MCCFSRRTFSWFVLRNDNSLNVLVAFSRVSFYSSCVSRGYSRSREMVLFQSQCPSATLLRPLSNASGYDCLINIAWWRRRRRNNNVNASVCPTCILLIMCRVDLHICLGILEHSHFQRPWNTRHKVALTRDCNVLLTTRLITYVLLSGQLVFARGVLRQANDIQYNCRVQPLSALISIFEL